MTRFSSLRMKQQETATAFYESDGEIQGSSSSSSRLMSDALEAERKILILQVVHNFLTLFGPTRNLLCKEIKGGSQS